MKVMNNSFEELGIKIKGNKVQQKTQCPNCISIGKTNTDDPCLSVNIELGKYKCHKCGWSGVVGMDLDTALQMENRTDLTDNVYRYLLQRGLSSGTVENSNIVQFEGDDNSVIFEYVANGKVVNWKKRSITEKRFSQMVGGRHSLYNYDEAKVQAEEKKLAVVTEGEIDAESFKEIGLVAVSVDSGAPNENDSTADRKLECITNCYDLFELAEVVYIAVDNDPNGKRLQKELIQRVGIEKVKIIDFSPWKDANEVLVYEGKESLNKRLKEARDVKLDGVFTLADVSDLMDGYFDQGKPKGTTTYFPELDEAWTHRKTDVNLWIGYNNEGKSTFSKQLALIKSAFEGVIWACYMPEDMPLVDFYDDLIEMYVGKSCDKDNPYRMSKSEYNIAKSFMSKHFIVLKPKELPRLKDLAEMVKFARRKYGAEGYIFDPYNAISHDSIQAREDLYIRDFMTKLKDMTVDLEMYGNLTAHLNTPSKIDSGANKGLYPKPDKYRIKGGGTFSDRADNILSVWRKYMPVDRTNPLVYFESQKIRKQKLVGFPQEVEMVYDFNTHRYRINNFSPLGKIIL